jgi:aminoglycoside 6'-N-acetyltransferase
MRSAGGDIVLRPATPRDGDALWAIMQEPAVARWWGGDTRADLDETLTGQGGSVAFVIAYRDQTAGMIQYAEETDPHFRHAAIDLFLTTRLHRRGIGSESIRLMVALLQERGHHRITIDPASENVAAIECYRSVGFREVGTMRAHWLDTDGRWRDGLLMELVLLPQATSGSSPGSSGSAPDPGVTRRSSA